MGRLEGGLFSLAAAGAHLFWHLVTAEAPTDPSFLQVAVVDLWEKNRNGTNKNIQGTNE